MASTSTGPRYPPPPVAPRTRSKTVSDYATAAPPSTPSRLSGQDSSISGKEQPVAKRRLCRTLSVLSPAAPGRFSEKRSSEKFLSKVPEVQTDESWYSAARPPRNSVGEQASCTRSRAMSQPLVQGLPLTAAQKAAKWAAENPTIDVSKMDKRPPAPLPKPTVNPVNGLEPRPRSMSMGVRPRVAQRTNHPIANNSLSLQSSHTLPAESTYKRPVLTDESPIYDMVDSDIGSLSDTDSDVDRYAASCAMISKTSETVRKVLGKSGSSYSSFSESGSLWSNATERRPLQNSDSGELLEAWEIYVSVTNKDELPDSNSDCSDDDIDEADEIEDEPEYACSGSSSSSEDSAREFDSSTVTPKPPSSWRDRVGRRPTDGLEQDEDDDYEEETKLNRANAVRRRFVKSQDGTSPHQGETNRLPVAFHRRRKTKSFILAKAHVEKVLTTERFCDDCRQWKETEFRQLDMRAAVCEQCQSHRRKRCRAAAELLSSEERYGGYLEVIQQVFMVPMQSSLISDSHHAKIFLNLTELLEVNKKLQDSLLKQIEEVKRRGVWEEIGHQATVGCAFLEQFDTLKAFEVYCMNHEKGIRLLSHLSKKSELLSSFLRACQAQDERCASMPLLAFLIAPVQRIMRYPLLLYKLLSHTPARHPDRSALTECLSKLEVLLDRINTTSPLPGFSRLQLHSRLSSAKQSLADVDLQQLKKVAAERLEWEEENCELVHHGPLEICKQRLGSGRRYQSSSFVKRTAIHGLLVQRNVPARLEDDPAGKSVMRFSLPRDYENRQPYLVLLGRGKTGSVRCQKNPIQLERCVVMEINENDAENLMFELTLVHQHTTMKFKAPGRLNCEEWLQKLRSATNSAGLWRQRRKALPNIMRFDLSQLTQ